MRNFLKQITFPKRLNLLFISIFLFGVATSMNAVIFPTILSLKSVSPTNIGIAFSTDVFGGIIMSFLLHRLVKNLGIMKSLAISAIGYALVTAAIFFYQGFLIWLFFAFFMGMCFFAFNITRYAWMNILLTSHRRSVALGIFSMVLASGVAAGPVIVKFSGAQNYISFLLSAAITISSLLFLTPMRGSDKVRIASKRIPLVEFFKKNPRCFLARFFLDFQSYLLLTLTVVFGGKIGLSPEKSGLLITACMISGFSDVWVGFLLKKGDSYKMIRYGFLGCVICFAGVIFFYHSYLFLLIAYFLFGVSVAFIYVSAFKLTNDDYKKSHLISANSTFQLIGSLGGLFGSLIGGFFIDIFQQIGLPIAIIASASLYLILTIFHRAQIKK